MLPRRFSLRQGRRVLRLNGRRLGFHSYAPALFSDALCRASEVGMKLLNVAEDKFIAAEKAGDNLARVLGFPLAVSI